MKMYTTPEQTAKLIELGFEKPSPNFYQNGATWIQCEGNYSIGELIEMLPEHIFPDGRCMDLYIYPCQYLWVVKYSALLYGNYYHFCSKELTDALYEMVVKLKEEGLI